MLVENSLLENYGKEYDKTRINDRYSIVHVPVNRSRMCSLGSYPYHIFPTLYITNSQLSLTKSEVTTVQSNPNLALFGQGVVIGFADTGIDYQHEAFRNPDGSTRLFSLWDQTVEEGQPPEGFTLGSEYNKTTLNQALNSEEPLTVVPSIDEDGHGTMLAGIAAGTRNNAVNFSGVATESELIFVKLAPAKEYNKRIFSVQNSDLCYPSTNILLALEYIRKVASTLNRPLVICFGLGSSQGDHSGLGAVSTYLNNLSVTPGMGVSVSAGNEGNNRRHYRGQIPLGQNFRDFEVRVSENDPDFFIELWQKSPSRLSIEMTSPSGERVPTVAPRLNQCIEHNFVLESTKVYINNFILEDQTGEQLILFRFQDAMSGIWTIRATNIDDISSEFNVWLPAGPLISTDTYFLEPDPYTTITSPGNAHNSITVTAYNQIDNSILIASSRGFSANNMENPDIAAPGYRLQAPVANNNYGTATGTGAAAAHVAGIVALLLEWAIPKGNYTTITGRDIGRLLIRGSRRDPSLEYPNQIWGYGQVDLMGVFRSLI